MNIHHALVFFYTCVSYSIIADLIHISSRNLKYYDDITTMLIIIAHITVTIELTF